MYLRAMSSLIIFCNINQQVELSRFAHYLQSIHIYNNINSQIYSAGFNIFVATMAPLYRRHYRRRIMAPSTNHIDIGISAVEFRNVTGWHGSAMVWSDNGIAWAKLLVTIALLSQFIC